MFYRKKLPLFFVALLTFLLFLPVTLVYGETYNPGATISVMLDDEYVVETTALSFTDGDTAFDLLQAVAEVEFEETDYGPFITGINGQTPEGDDYWGFFINGVEAQVGAADYTLQNGDNVLFKITSFPPETVQVKVSAKDLEGNLIIDETAIEVVKGATAYDALVQAAVVNGLNIDVSVDSDWLTFLNDIDGQLNDTSTYWASFINDTYMQTGLVQYLLQDGDHLHLQIEGMTDTPATEDGSESASFEAASLNEETLNRAILDALQYLDTHDRLDWYGLLALLPLGEELPETILQETLTAIEENDGEYKYITDLAKHIIIVTAYEKSATNLDGTNLIELLVNHAGMIQQGNNGPIFALLALDSGNYEIPDNADWTREALVDFLLNAQLSDGSWSLTGDIGSADMTGLALAALAPYAEDGKIQEAIDRALNWISENMDETGGFYDEYSDGNPSESIAQVIIGLMALGKNPTAETYTKNGVNLIQALLAYQDGAGGFRHLPTDEEGNTMSTNQALLALTAYQENVNVFDLSDRVPSGASEDTGNFTPVLIGAGIILIIVVAVSVLMKRRKARNL